MADNEMNRLSHLSHHTFGLGSGLIFILGALTAAGLILAAGMEAKWMVFIILVIISSYVILIIPNREKFFLYLAVFFIPVKLDFNLIYFSPERFFRPVNGTTISVFDLCFFVVFISWIFRLATDRKEKIHFYPYVSLPMLLIFTLAFLGIWQSNAPMIISAWSLLVILRNWLVFLYLANNCRDMKTILMLVSMFLATILFQSFFGFGQLLTGGTLGAGLFGESESSYLVMRTGGDAVNRIAGTCGHPNQLAKYLELILPLNFSLLFAPILKRYRVIIAFIFASGAMAIILTYSRGAWGGLAIGGSITLYWCLAKMTRQKVISFLILVSIAATVSLSAIMLIEPVRKRLFEHDYGAAYTRIPMAEIALNIISHNPLLGVGLGNYTRRAIEYDRSRESMSYIFPMPVHNEFLLMAAELGLPALGLFLFLLMVVFRQLMALGCSEINPIISYMAIGLLGGLMAWCIHQQINYHYALLSYLLFYFGIVQAMSETVKNKDIQAMSETLKNKERVTG